MFTNFLAYKLERKGGLLVEIDRWFPSSKLCSNCFYQMGEMPLDVREWTCPHCKTRHDRDGNAAHNIRAEGIRILKLAASPSSQLVGGGNPVTAVGGEISPKGGSSTQRLTPTSTEAPSDGSGGVVHYPHPERLVIVHQSPTLPIHVPLTINPSSATAANRLS